MSARFTLEQHTAELTVQRPGYTCVAYGGTRYGESTYRHAACRKTFKSSRDRVLKTRFCPVCETQPSKTGVPPKDKAQRQQELNELFGDGAYTLLTYTTTTEPAKFRHACGRTKMVQRAETLLRGQARCDCKLSKVFGRTKNGYNEELKQLGSGFVCTVYNGLGNTVNTYRHQRCGKKFERSFNSMRLTKHCPHCLAKDEAQRALALRSDYAQRIAEKFQGAWITLDPVDKWGDYEIRCRHSCGTEQMKSLDTMLRSRDPLCDGCKAGKTYNRKRTVRVGGVDFRLTGYEPQAVKILARQHGARSIACGREVPRFDYTFQGKRSRYFPDFYVRKDNRIVEVKGLATAGLLPDGAHPFGKDLWKRLIAKARAVQNAGYDFELMLLQGSDVIKLPDGWQQMSVAAMRRFVNGHSTKVCMTGDCE